MSPLQLYLDSVRNAINGEQGVLLSTLLSLNRHSSQKFHSELSKIKDFSFIQRMGLSWADIICMHLKVYQATNKPTYRQDDEPIVQIATDQIHLVQNFHQQFSSLQKWSLPILYTVNREMKRLCKLADEYLIRNNQKPQKVEEGVRTTYKAFTYCATDRFSPLDQSRKWGTYTITNLLFQTYFYLDAINLCNNLYRALAASDLPPLDTFPISQRLTFKFYRGALHFLEEKYSEATDDLEYAFTHCPTNNLNNKRTILKYLIPVKILKGCYPSPDLFEKYNIPKAYPELVYSIQTGNIFQFNQLLEEHQELWIELGVYILVEKLSWICFRNACRIIWTLLDKTHHVRMEYFSKGYTFFGGEISQDGMECMLANMIDKGLMKGYLSHEKQTVVLSKQDPFPALAQLTIN